MKIGYELISTKDRLPDNSEEVLVYEKWNDIPFIGWYSAKEKKWFLNTDFVEIDGDAYLEDNINQHDIIYWSVLPEAPQ